ncbi:MAG: hypothetical protein ABIK73_00725 [candidate division WOR-3 bacterium]
MVAIAVLSVVLAGIIFLRFTYYGQLITTIISNRLSGRTHEDKLLYTKITELSNALIKNTPNAIYNLFNSSFQATVLWDSFLNAYQNWLNNRKIKGIRFTNIKRIGRLGHVSSLIRFNTNEEKYMYQSWILTQKGWRLVWLTNFLPKTFLRYGEGQKYSIQEIKQLAIKELFENGRIKLITHSLKIPKTIFIKAERSRKQTYYHAPGYTIKELTLPAIKTQAYKTDAFYYVEFATIRIIDDIASIYIDIVPLYREVPGLNRRRGLQLFFVNQNYPCPEAHWVYEGVGALW